MFFAVCYSSVGLFWKPSEFFICVTTYVPSENSSIWESWTISWYLSLGEWLFNDAYLVNFGSSIINFKRNWFTRKALILLSLATHLWISEAWQCWCFGGQQGVLLMWYIVVIHQEWINYDLQAKSAYMPPHENIYYLAPRKSAGSCHML